ncbi:MAG: pyrroline-5-carboxylate reductase [Candidatus Marinimicrobia bacterium]|nr:pyrroline-5-carboxylate reductase [Candidatus Neomarinimicrobiota bacterium]MCF7828666.1 pyrroline-5-carboxylate reductase [Candidatus Neomarinimicrobiota bacterium]MCF7880407.1 pyrroline-5-carboxylate reductase [Candidatus Neomarinimicrobiota bacterium]
MSDDIFAKKITVLGAGNIGQAIARGFVQSGKVDADQVTLTRRNLQFIEEFEDEGYHISKDNREAVRSADLVIIAVQPQQLVGLLNQIKDDIDPQKHILMSIVTAVSINEILKHLEKDVPVVRVMPNTAIEIGESMTCIAARPGSEDAIDATRTLFELIGQVVVLDENRMTPATALVACGIAFFLRAIRAASQGGIEIGFHSEEALIMAAQTAKGAASLLLKSKHHPESEIDKVTTPRGCTIGGLNRMEHEGFSSAMIKGILTSADLAEGLYDNPNGEE